MHESGRTGQLGKLSRASAPARPYHAIPCHPMPSPCHLCHPSRPCSCAAQAGYEQRSARDCRSPSPTCRHDRPANARDRTRPGQEKSREGSSTKAGSRSTCLLGPGKNTRSVRHNVKTLSSNRCSAVELRVTVYACVMQYQPGNARVRNWLPGASSYRIVLPISQLDMEASMEVAGTKGNEQKKETSPSFS